ncbi:unnamed protein product [Toxocara canis]|uniref:PID domain-containing protein n=1 Tax=Toxocara canis TaxID=6265 RepID=A0A183UC05_TOXCA|nr:unnamed protein product [Toxocara canis]
MSLSRKILQILNFSISTSQAGHVVQGTCVGGRQSRSPKCYQPLINDKMHMHQLGDITRRSSYGNGLEGLRPIRHHSAGCCASAESGSLSETDSLSSRYVSAASTQNDSLSSYMDGLAAPFVLPLRETLIYQCFLLSLGAVPIMYTRSAASIVNKAIVSLKNQAIVARTVFMQIYYKMIVVYNKRREITHRLLATNIDVAVASAENRQLLGVIVSSPRRDRFVCHVFGTDEQLLFHFAHGKYTRRYGVNCTSVAVCLLDVVGEC